MKKRLYIALAALLALAFAFPALAEGAESYDLQLSAIPQIDSSTARIPITDAIYQKLTAAGLSGSAPICSKTHGAWLNLADGSADILFLIAPTEDELNYFAERNVDIEMKVFGFDGLVFLGNASNPVDNLTSADIRAIYSKRISNWWSIFDDLNAEIVAYIRNEESGSQRLFESLVWDGYDMPDFQSMDFLQGEVEATSPHQIYLEDEMEGITYSVIRNRYSIGFNIMSYVDSEFLNPKNGAACVVTTGSVNLRSGPGLDYPTLTAIESGIRLEYLGEGYVDDRGIAWYKVRHDGVGEAWISSRYSEFDSAGDSLKLFSIDGYAPTTENFANGNYPYVTTSYVVIRADEPEDSDARKLFNWIGSDESREIIANNSTLSVSFSDPVVIRTGASRLDSEGFREAVESASRDLLTRADLYAYTQEELEYLWQSIYAASGLRFTRAKYRGFFSQFSWYAPHVDSYAEAAESMNDVQRQNLALLTQYLNELRRAAGAVQPRTLAYASRETDMSGDDVWDVQCALVDAGYLSPVECDSKFSSDTADAVRRFQEDNGLESTGIVDFLTRLELM